MHGCFALAIINVTTKIFEFHNIDDFLLQIIRAMAADLCKQTASHGKQTVPNNVDDSSNLENAKLRRKRKQPDKEPEVSVAQADEGASY